MLFSLIVTTTRRPNAIKPLFLASSPNTEIIIVDSNYNNTTKDQLKQINHDFYKVTYAPPRKKIHQRDFSQCLNTAVAYAENKWIIKVDDSTEFVPGFFDKAAKSISALTNKFNNTNFIIRPIKLEEHAKHRKWDRHPFLITDAKYIELGRDGIGDGFFSTLDQAIFTQDIIDKMNGYDERYDLGHGYDDNDIMQRFLTLGCPIILVQELLTFQHEHTVKRDTIDITRILYQFNIIEILNGRYYAYNNFNLKEIREKMLLEKTKYEL